MQQSNHEYTFTYKDPREPVTPVQLLLLHSLHQYGNTVLATRKASLYKQGALQPKMLETNYLIKQM